ncbi:hypothetical protein V1502_04775 [Bacillus sp. SCS-153A]|uniref:hypothetical protein n=1 Tax=Rossellomorea sedimentorum TaxID=3115294 RepID=UPI003906B7C6
MKIKTLSLIILLFLLVFGGFYTYLKTSQLEKPLFLSHYYQKEIIDSSVDYIPIHYITNQDEGWHLVSVNSKEIPGHLITVEGDYIRHQEGVFQQHEAHLSIEGIEKDESVLHELIFTFANGTVVEAGIGEILLESPERSSQEEQVVHIIGGGSSNQGESFSFMNINRDARLTDVTLQFTEILSPALKLAWDTVSETVDPEAVDIEDIKSKGDLKKLTHIELPVELEADERLRLNAVMDKESMFKNDIHAIEADITGTFVTDGGEIQQNLMRINEQPYLTSKQIKELKKLREEGRKSGEGN